MKPSVKTILLSICTVVCAVVIGLLAMIPLPSNKAYTAKAWMSELPDDASVKTLSIPGTHDSGAMHSIVDLAGRCQDISIEHQLNVGVRFFDLRLQLVNNRFKIVHSFVDQKLTLLSVLNDFNKFLTEHPSEFLLVSIKEESGAVNSTMEFEQALLSELQPFEAIADYSNTLPSTVGQARGKMFFISRYNNASIGVPAYNGWLDSTTFTLGELYVQDNYSITDIEVKKSDILSALEYTRQNPLSLTLNFTSCYLDGFFPPAYAGETAKAINPWFSDYVSEWDGPLGVVVADFITAQLSELIYGRNFQ